MTIKLVVGGVTINVVSVYPPQVRLEEEVKKIFWCALDELIQGIPVKLFIREDLNWNIGSSMEGYEGTHEGFGHGSRKK